VSRSVCIGPSETLVLKGLLPETWCKEHVWWYFPALGRAQRSGLSVSRVRVIASGLAGLLLAMFAVASSASATPGPSPVGVVEGGMWRATHVQMSGWAFTGMR
jgi:hypothetical protein